MVYSTNILKNASEILETNAMSEKVSEINGSVQPTIKIEPYINILKTDTAATATIYTTPTDKDFYLTNAAISCNVGGGAAGTATLTFVLRSGETQTINAVVTSDIGDSTAVTLPIQFPLRGLLLAKGSTIVSTSNTDVQSFTIAGYLGSDRSGI